MRPLRIYIILTLLTVNISAFSSYAQWNEPIRISQPGRFLYPSIEAQGDTLHIVADRDGGDGLIRYYRSSDNGNEWSAALVLPDPTITDASYLPSLAVETSNIYASWLSIDYIGPRFQNIGFRKSTDGGSTWLPPVLVLAQDRVGVLVPTFGVVDQFLYVMYAEYLDSGLHFLTAKSLDQGETWSYPDTLFGVNYVSGRGIETAARGDTIHVLWTGSFSNSTPSQVYYFRSTDGGQSWSDSFALRTTEQRGAPMAAFSVNETGDLVACWLDYRYASFGFRGDIFCRTSFDGGESWGDEIQLTYDHESIMPDVDWTGINLFVAYEDWRFNRREIWFRRSSDNGQSWGEEERLTDDYIEDRNPCVAGAADGNVYVVYSKIIDNPDSLEYTGVYLKRYEQTVGITDPDRDIPNSIALLKAYPNPFNTSVVLSIILPERGETAIEIFDICGRLVKTIFEGGNLEKGTHKFTWDATDADGKAVSSGLYFAVAGTPQGKITQRLTLIR
jgi:hypothetical protein